VAKFQGDRSRELGKRVAKQKKKGDTSRVKHKPVRNYRSGRPKKCHYDRLRNDRALRNRKYDNNENPNNNNNNNNVRSHWEPVSKSKKYTRAQAYAGKCNSTRSSIISDLWCLSVRQASQSFSQFVHGVDVRSEIQAGRSARPRLKATPSTDDKSNYCSEIKRDGAIIHAGRIAARSGRARRPRRR